ncbi:MAG: 16S rRNA (cytidine(1402)-2'-O)-methyltransferase [Holosporaceae bacterium]|nr:16S rRNA (cytidine(1402)-2'-O)-methyltransferase [Holosporaceae bacterium]
MPDTFSPPQYSETNLYKLYNQNHKPGLYVVATPIGNIFDISLRAIYILDIAKCIFAEDTRQSRKLLDFYNIKTRVIPCHEHNELSRSVMEALQSGGIYALISDAGTPLVSDPGYRLVGWCIRNNIEVFPIPGACAPVAAVSVAGLPTDKFIFLGFPPPKEKAKIAFLSTLKNITATMVFLESPKRIVNTLQNMRNIWGDRRCCICRELTKVFEEIKRGNLSELGEYFSKRDPIGEFTVVVAGCGQIISNETESEIYALLRQELERRSLREAVKIISDSSGISKKAIYQKALELKLLADESPEK